MNLGFLDPYEGKMCCKNAVLLNEDEFLFIDDSFSSTIDTIDLEKFLVDHRVNVKNSKNFL